jgi:hypothetical protein
VLSERVCEYERMCVADTQGGVDPASSVGEAADSTIYLVPYNRLNRAGESCAGARVPRCAAVHTCVCQGGGGA